MKNYFTILYILIWLVIEINSQKVLKNLYNNNCLQIASSSTNIYAIYTSCLSLNTLDSLSSIQANPQTLYFVPASAATPLEGSIVSRFLQNDLCLTYTNLNVYFSPCSISNQQQTWLVNGTTTTLVAAANPSKCLGTSPNTLVDCAAASPFAFSTLLSSKVIIWDQPNYRGKAVVLSLGNFVTLSSSSISVSVPPGFTLVDQSSNFNTLTKDTASWSLSGTLTLTVSLLPGAVLFSNENFMGLSYYVAYSSLGQISNPVGSTLSLILDNTASGTIFTVLNTTSGYAVTFSRDMYPQIYLPQSLNAQIASNRCSQGCSTNGICQPDGSCSCTMSNWIGPSCSTCAPGYYGPQCVPCLASCKQTLGPNSVCEDGVTGTGQCICGDGFAGPTCQDCAPSRFGPTCTVPSFCNNGFFSPQEKRCICYPGYYNNPAGSNCSLPFPGTTTRLSGAFSVPPAYTEREACFQGCIACASQSLTCLACTTGTNLNSDGQQCGTDISSGSSSSNCLFFRDQNQSYCGTCNTNRYPTNGQCSWALSQNSCISTFSGKQYNSSFYNSVKKQCDSCQYPCASCSSATTCLSCTPPYMYLASENKCYSTCPAGFLPSADKARCDPCASQCATCDKSSASFCTQCSDPTKLAINGTCVTSTTSCPKNFYLNSTLNVCSPCDQSCSSCIGSLPTQCVNCAYGFTYSSNAKTCYLTDCTGKNPSSLKLVSNGVCLACDSSCAECTSPSSPNACLSCSNSNDVIFNGVCLSSCPPGYAETSAKSCTLCSAAEGNVLSSVGNCIACPGFYNQTAVISNSGDICNLCSSNCSTCSISPNNCTSCADILSYKIENGSCAPINTNSTGTTLANLSGNSAQEPSGTPWYVAAVCGSVGFLAIAAGIVIVIRKKNKDARMAATTRKLDDLEAEISEARVSAISNSLAFTDDIFDSASSTGRLSRSNIPTKVTNFLSPVSIATSMNSSANSLHKSLELVSSPNVCLSTSKRSHSNQSLLSCNSSRLSINIAASNPELYTSREGLEIDQTTANEERKLDGLPTYSFSLTAKPDAEKEKPLDLQTLLNLTSKNKDIKLDSLPFKSTNSEKHLQAVPSKAAPVGAFSDEKGAQNKPDKEAYIKYKNLIGSLASSIKSGINSNTIQDWLQSTVGVPLINVVSEGETLPLASNSIICRLASFQAKEVILREQNPAIWEPHRNESRIISLCLEAAISRVSCNAAKILGFTATTRENVCQALVFPLYSGDLHTLLCDTSISLPLSFTMNLYLQTVEAVQAMHNLNIVLINLNPAMIMLESISAANGQPRYQVKLADFSLAYSCEILKSFPVFSSYLKQLNLTLAACETAYVAPEIYGEQDRIGFIDNLYVKHGFSGVATIDVYSLGRILELTLARKALVRNVSAIEHISFDENTETANALVSLVVESTQQGQRIALSELLNVIKTSM